MRIGKVGYGVVQLALVAVLAGRGLAAPAPGGAPVGTPPSGDGAAPAASTTAEQTKAGAVASAEVAKVVQEALKQAPSLMKGLPARDSWTGLAEVALYFLPDGRAVDPLPVDLSERDRISLYILIPASKLGTERLEVTACPDRNPYRVNGSFVAATSTIRGVGQAAVEGESYVARSLGTLDCGAGQVSFHVGIADPAAPEKELVGMTHTLSLGPVYWGTVGIQYGFDFTKSGALSAQTSPGGHVIARSDDLLGPKVSPAFLWHPFGLDPRHPSVLGILVNPELAFDLDAITTSFFVGDSLCWNGLCLSAGAHIRKTDQLTRSSGLAVGMPFDPTTGDLPIEQRWSKADGGIGFVGGVVLDVNTAARIIGGDK